MNMHNHDQAHNEIKQYLFRALLVLLVSIGMLARVSTANASAQARPGERCF
jgi:hypothetical protein